MSRYSRQRVPHVGNRGECKPIRRRVSVEVRVADAARPLSRTAYCATSGSAAWKSSGVTSTTATSVDRIPGCLGWDSAVLAATTALEPLLSGSKCDCLPDTPTRAGKSQCLSFESWQKKYARMRTVSCSIRFNASKCVSLRVRHPHPP